jgi:hypothetical protein
MEKFRFEEARKSQLAERIARPEAGGKPPCSSAQRSELGRRQEKMCPQSVVVRLTKE